MIEKATRVGNPWWLSLIVDQRMLTANRVLRLGRRSAYFGVGVLG